MLGMRAGTVATLIALVIAGSFACASQAPSPLKGSEVIPGLDLKFGDEIPAVDLAFQDQVAHVVWVEQRRNAGDQLASQRLMYVKKDLKTGKWSTPRSVSGQTEGPVRIIASDDALHVISGGNLSHLVSRNAGESWIPADSLVAPSRYTLVWDVASPRGTLLLASVQPKTPNQVYAAADTLALWTRRLGKEPVRVAVMPKPARGRPVAHLAESGDSVDLFYGVSERMVPPDGDKRVSRISTRIFLARSGDAGATWSPLREIKGLPDWSSPEGSIGSIAAARSEGMTVVAFAGHELFAVRSEADGSWSTPIRFCRAPVGWVHPSSSPSTVSMVASRDGGWVLWIDTRYARTDRPFSGFPFSDRLDWANNDVLVLPLSKLNSAHWPDTTCAPQRLTKDLSFAKQLRVRPGAGRIYALWSGLEKVGRSLEEFKSPPRLFFGVLPD